MAFQTLEANNNDDEQPFTIRTTLESDDESTEMAGANRKKKDEEEKEKLVKWQIPGHYDNAGAKKALLHMIAALLVNHPQDVTFIDRKQREWTYDEAYDEAQFLQEFDKASIQLHAIKNKEKKVARWVSITKIISTSNTQEWKNNDPFYSTVTETKAYISPHTIGQDQWDIIGIGFIKNIHAIHYPKELLQQQSSHMMKNQEKQIPTFQLIPQRITSNNKIASTKAYSIQCLRDDAPKLIHHLTHGAFREKANQIFVPFKYKRTKPDIFLKCIRQQNKIYHKTWVIKLEGITQDVMNIIESDINQIMGVLHVVPSKRYNESGEWKILTDQTKCSYIHRQLTDQWQNIISKVPQEILDDSPSNFTTPMISSKRAREYQDNESDEDSYGSLLTTGTDISAMTNDETTYNEPPAEYMYPSYASAAMASQTSLGDTQISSPTASTVQDWQREKQELEALIKLQALQIERIQADLESKMSRSQDLEEKLAQAIDLEHSRDARHEEMLRKVEMLLNNQSVDGYTQGKYYPYDSTNHEAHNPSTPEKAPTTAEAPPPKKANTNSSPNRSIYSLFRQQSGKQMTHRATTTSNRSNTTKRTNQMTVYQPMETDESDRQPSTEAKKGQMKE